MQSLCIVMDSCILTAHQAASAVYSLWCVHVTPCTRLQAKPYHRVDYSHSKVKLMKIAHDNQLLVQRLTSISHKVTCREKDCLASTATVGLFDEPGFHRMVINYLPFVTTAMSHNSLHF